MYTCEMIQEMIDTLKSSNRNKDSFYEAFCNSLEGINKQDKMAIKYVLEDGSYEAFDRFDSDVCETFILLYEKSQDEINLNNDCEREI